MNIKRLVLFLISPVILQAVPLSAGTIPDLFDTGVGSNGASLPDGTSPDLHYTIVSSSDGSTASTVTVKTSTSGYPVSDWNGDNTTSAWLMPSGAYPDNFGGPTDFTHSGNYDYQTTFTLPSGVTSINVSAGVALDNELAGILVNGQSVGSFATGNTLADLEGGTFSGFDQFNLISFSDNNVQPGTNSLTFVVHNDAGPTGLRVDEIAGTFTVAVPEPASISLLFIGSLALIRCTRFQKPQ
jgi:hypothetical protein